MAAKTEIVIPKKSFNTKQFEKELAKNLLSKVFVFFEPDNTDINDYLSIYKNALNISEQNIYTYNGAELSLAQFINEYCTQPLFSERRLFIIKDINNCQQKRNKQLLESFYSALDESIADTFLFVCNEKVFGAKITEFLKNVINRLFFFNAQEVSVEQWIIDYAQKNKREIDYNAVKRLAVLCGGKTPYIKNELDKIFLFDINGKNISDELVKKLVQNYDENDIFKFINTIINKNYDKAVAQFRQLLNQKQNINVIIYNLVEKFSKLIYFIETAKKMKMPDAYKIGDLVLKEHKVMLNYFEKNEFLKIYSKYNDNSLKQILQLLIELDETAKSKPSYYLETAFEIFLLKSAQAV